MVVPIYAYKCSACGHEQDVLQKVSDPLLVDCPQCGRPALVKQLTAAGFQLKGTGWYVTDFRDGGKPAQKAAPSGEAGAPAGDGGGSAASTTSAAPSD